MGTECTGTMQGWASLALPWPVGIDLGLSAPYSVRRLVKGTSHWSTRPQCICCKISPRKQVAQLLRALVVSSLLLWLLPLFPANRSPQLDDT
jgi:hypothetical protein